ncbi:MAG TPA: Rossmann-like and DUF2520 domain-containing protein [Actinomycetota bacterium]|nr:Rossmann-like and DUF2520 domain-containing protein [Actinomycetota bacterium]
MDVAVVGAGRVGTALAVLLSKAGHRMVGVSGGEGTRKRAETYLPGVPFLPAHRAASEAEVVVIGVPDDAIAAVCDDLASAGALHDGQGVCHLSGAAPLLALGPARAAAARVFSMHPVQTFPDVDAGIERLPGSHVAVTAWEEEGFRMGESLARDAGGRPLRVNEEHKALYHAAAVFSSNWLVTVEAIAERLFREAGIEDPIAVMDPLIRGTVDNIVGLGPAAALTGPVVRGDAGTVRRNLEALASHAPDAVDAYVSLARASLDLAERAGRLIPGSRDRVEEVLDEWRS